MPYTKDCPARVKAAGEADGLEPGQFTALVSVFGNEDSMGDVVMPGAFADTLAEWAAKGDPIPVVWSHDWSDPFSHIGTVVKAEESPDGLLVTGQIDTDGNPKAEQVYRLLKGRRVTQFSFAYDILDAGWGEREDGEVYELRKLKLHEVGPTLLGANQETELLAAKARALVSGVKEGRVLAAAHVDKLKTAHAAIGEVIAAADPDKATKPTPAPSGQTGTAAAGDDTSPAKTAEPGPADSELIRKIYEHLTAGTLPAVTGTDDETKSTSREAPSAAGAGPASIRLRTDLAVLAAEVSTLTD